MGRIAGVAYPDLFKSGSLLTPMLDMFSSEVSSVPRNELTLQQIQLGVCGSPLDTLNKNVAAIDGRLYSRKSLHAALALDHPEYEYTDTQLILHAYQKWGYSFLEHLSGDFALFVYDQNKEVLLLGRDRIGKKPLYWYHDQNHFLFASGLKALLATGFIPQTLAPDSVASYLYFGFLPQDMTPIKGLNKLLPGNYLLYHLNQRKEIHSYWSYSACFQKRTTESKPEIISHIDYLVQDAVSERLATTKSFGCWLSGGLGSASVAHYLHKEQPFNPFTAYSVIFEGENNEDLNAAKEVAQSLHLTHRYETITPENCMESLVEIVWHLDEPLADLNTIATWNLAKLSQAATSIFSGMGSDELLAGHSRYSMTEQPRSYLDKIKQSILPYSYQSLIPIFQLFYPQAVFNVLQRLRIAPRQLSYLNKYALFGLEELESAAPQISSLFDPHIFLHKFPNLSRIPSTVSSFLYLDVKTRLPDCYILQYERLTKANKINWKTPFLSEKLIEYMASIPEPEELIEEETFHILKNILKDKLPENFIYRPKRTRKKFLSSWVDTPAIARAFSLLPKGALVEVGLISESWLLDKLSSREKRTSSFQQLWGILILEIWYRLFITRPLSHTIPKMSVESLFKEIQ